MPVIPVAMIDTEKTMPTGRKIPHLRPRPGVRFGKPLDFSRYEGLAGDRFVERSMTDEIMYELMQLSGQEYVDTYAAKVKLQTGADLGFGAKRGHRARRRGRQHRATTGCRPSGPAEPRPRALLLRLRVHRGRHRPSRWCRSASSTRTAGSSTRSPPSSTRTGPSTGCAGTCSTSCPSPADPAWRSRDRDPRRPAGLPARARRADRAVGLDGQLRPRGAGPAVGRHAGAAPPDSAIHP